MGRQNLELRYRQDEGIFEGTLSIRVYIAYHIYSLGSEGCSVSWNWESLGVGAAAAARYVSGRDLVSSSSPSILYIPLFVVCIKYYI